jgi:hypothetical protein
MKTELRQKITRTATLLAAILISTIPADAIGEQVLEVASPFCRLAGIIEM